jgi:hypothetical protein
MGLQTLMAAMEMRRGLMIEWLMALQMELLMEP